MHADLPMGLPTECRCELPTDCCPGYYLRTVAPGYYLRTAARRYYLRTAATHGLIFHR